VARDPASLAERTASYEEVGATRPGDAAWPRKPKGYRAYEHTVLVGHGEALWNSAAAALLRWGVKTRSGFHVRPVPERSVRVGDRVWLRGGLGPVGVSEPVFVVAVVEEPDRRGFAYGTLEGHPVAGEEAFVLHRDPDGCVWLTLRSLTRAPQGSWRLAFPLALAAQRWYRRRYERALRVR